MLACMCEHNAGTKSDRIEEAVARRLLEALMTDNPTACVEPLDLGDETVIDGRFNVRAVARALLDSAGVLRLDRTPH